LVLDLSRESRTVIGVGQVVVDRLGEQEALFHLGKRCLIQQLYALMSSMENETAFKL